MKDKRYIAEIMQGERHGKVNFASVRSIIYFRRSVIIRTMNTPRKIKTSDLQVRYYKSLFWKIRTDAANTMHVHITI